MLKLSSKMKRDYRCPAKEMYSASPLFRKAYNYAKKNYDLILILSGQHHLLLPEKEIDPYQCPLDDMSVSEREAWAKIVFGRILEKLEINTIEKVFFHAGEKYREFLLPMLQKRGIQCIVPLEGLKVGKQLAWYDQHKC